MRAIFLMLLILSVLPPINGDNFQIHNVGASVSINAYIAMGLSTDLLSGVSFSNLDPDSMDNNATSNYLGASNETLYSVLISTDSNANGVNMCTKLNEPFKDGSGNEIGLSYYTWNSSDSANYYSPSVPGISFETDYDNVNKIDSDIPIGQSRYLRFWLDVPEGQLAGTYNNTIYFQAVEYDEMCG
jgi:hypothetical protein